MQAQASQATEATLTTIERFNEAFNRHDVNAVMALMTDDCVFENTSPRPDGEHYEGQTAVRGFWERLFRSTPDARFTLEEIFAAGDRCAQCWRYDFTGGDGRPGHIRGVDIMRIRNGKVAEKFSYVKG